MRHLGSFRWGRVAIGLAMAGGVCAPVVLAAAPASATSCGSAVAAGSSCTVTGTLGLDAGSLTMTSPSALGWTSTITGVDQLITDTTAAHQGYTVDDATGTAPGWHATVSATQFTTGGGTPVTLGNTGTLSTNASVTSSTDTTAPSTACASGSTCTLPTNTTTYPVAVTTAATSPTPATIYDANSATGAGTINVGGSGSSHPIGWWLSVPANAPAGSYTSTVTLELISGP